MFEMVGRAALGTKRGQDCARAESARANSSHCRLEQLIQPIAALDQLEDESDEEDLLDLYERRLADFREDRKSRNEDADDHDEIIAVPDIREEVDEAKSREPDGDVERVQGDESEEEPV